MDTQLKEKRVTSRKRTPNSEVEEETIVSGLAGAPLVDTAAARNVDTYEFTISKLNSVVWGIIGVINLLILLRFIFFLLGANNTGIVAFIYNLTNVFVAPFTGIFESARYGESFFDTASIVAIIMYLVIGLILTTLIRMFSTRERPVT